MTLEQEALRLRGLEGGTGPAPERKPSAWRWVARIVLVGFLALIFGFSYVYAERTTTVFMFVLFFIGLVYLLGQVHELRREVASLREDMAARKGKEEGKE